MKLIKEIKQNPVIAWFISSLLVGPAFALLWISQSNIDNLLLSIPSLIICALLTAVGVALILYYLLTELVKIITRKHGGGDRNKQIRNTLYQGLAEDPQLKVDADHHTKSADVLALMTLNMEELSGYFALSKSHAITAMGLATGMGIVGILLLVASIVLALIRPDTITPALIAGISGAVVEVFTGVILVIYNRSLAQLNFYYDALHRNEKFLSIVNLVEKMDPEKKDEVYLEVIHSELAALNSNEKPKGTTSSSKQPSA